MNEPKIIQVPKWLNHLTIKDMVLNLIENQGRYEMPIPRKTLEDQLRRLGFLVTKDDRPMRRAIEELRREGHLICHKKDKPDGYYLASNKAEYEDFRTREYRSRIANMADTMREMDKAAEAKFGEAVQLELFYL
ncbi:MAG: hypothetical protein ACOYKC_09090 [Anaerolineaceae bacterium]|jgi:hypothetical protein